MWRLALRGLCITRRHPLTVVKNFRTVTNSRRWDHRRHALLSWGGFLFFRRLFWSRRADKTPPTVSLPEERRLDTSRIRVGDSFGPKVSRSGWGGWQKVGNRKTPQLPKKEGKKRNGVKKNQSESGIGVPFPREPWDGRWTRKWKSSGRFTFYSQSIRKNPPSNKQQHYNNHLHHQ